MNDQCFFTPCSGSGELGNTKASRVIKASQSRGDDLHLQLLQLVAENENYKVKCHRNCISTYTSPWHISLSHGGSGQQKRSKSAPSPTIKKRLRQSQQPFHFRTHCIFCGELCNVVQDRKNPSRWRPAFICRSVDSRTNVSFKNSILSTCKERGNEDELARQVQMRIQGAVSDLCAVEARYHDDCRKRFMIGRKNRASTSIECGEHIVNAFDKLCNDMNQKKEKVWTSNDIFNLYKQYGGDQCKRTLCSKIKTYFGDRVAWFSDCQGGLSSLLIFRDSTSNVIKLVDNDEDEDNEIDRLIQIVGKKISKECKELAPDRSTYNVRINPKSCLRHASPTLLALLKSISDHFEKRNASIMIGNIVTGIVCGCPTPLQIGLGVSLNCKKLIEEFSDLGVACTYDEVRLFKGSAAAAVSSEPSPIGSAKDGLIQTIADNFDAEIASPNGLTSTHSLALLITQSRQSEEDMTDTEMIPRLKKHQLDEVEIATNSAVLTSVYKGPKKPLLPAKMAERGVLPLKVLAKQVHSAERAKSLDFDFLKAVTSQNPSPEFGGFNMQHARREGREPTASTTTMYRPLIDSKPSDPTTIKTAMEEAKRLTKLTGQATTLFTTDLQLYRIALNVQWVYPSLFGDDFINRLGGMHFLMSFIGAIGSLMSNSGLEDIMKAAFGGVAKMLTGKKYPQNSRALRLVAEELLRDTLTSVSSYRELLDELSTQAEASRTAKHWVNNLILPVFLIMIFVRAEREGDWALHLWAVHEMIPYFFASGHIHYARYSLVYLRSMEKLHGDILERFMKGEHVQRHRNGVWNGLWSDMFIETTFMRYGHGPRGLTGLTLNQSAVSRWALSLHTCSRLLKDVADMKDKEYLDDKRHKEEMPSRMAYDEKDRSAVRRKLNLCIHPLKPDEHPTGLVNIVTGRIHPESVNVENAKDIGNQQKQEFESSWPEGFHKPIVNKVKTMIGNQRRTPTDKKGLIDCELIFSRLMILIQYRDIDVKSVMGYELAPLPTSIFDGTKDKPEMRIAKAKATLKNTLQVEHSSRTLTRQPDAIFLDGCAIMWIVHWPSKGAIKDYVNAFVDYVLTRMSLSSNVFLVFDKYHESSIKSCTRAARAAGLQHSKKHNITLTTPIPSRDVILNVTHNKRQLIEIITEELLYRVQGLLLPSSLVVTGISDTPVEVKQGKRIERSDLRTTHEEADVILPHQVVQFASNTKKILKVISDDTDVFVLLMHYYHHSQVSASLLMEPTSPERTLVNIGDTVTKHKAIVPQLLAAHALTGCDTVGCYFGVGKGKAIAALKAGYKLDSIGLPGARLETVIKEATRFIAACYGEKVGPGENMSDIRYRQWISKMSRKSAVSVPKLKTLPPTTEAFIENVKRAHIQACIWRSALTGEAPAMDPLENGWELDESYGGLIPVTLPPKSEIAPTAVMKLIQCGCSSKLSCSTDRCGCMASQMSCSDFCHCRGERETCQNRWTLLKQRIEDISDSDAYESNDDDQ